MPHFVLVFWDLFYGNPPRDIRPLLLDDEKGNTSKQAKAIKHGGIHVFTTFKYVTATRTASFWCRMDAIDGMMNEGKWQVSIWRTDSWTRVTEPVAVKKNVTKKGTWDK